MLAAATKVENAEAFFASLLRGSCGLLIVQYCQGALTILIQVEFALHSWPLGNLHSDPCVHQYRRVQVRASSKFAWEAVCPLSFVSLRHKWVHFVEWYRKIDLEFFKAPFPFC